MTQKVSARFCLSDIRTFTHAQKAFSMIEQCKSAIVAAGCKVLEFSYVNKPNRIDNPRGDIGTFEFEIVAPDDVPRELSTSHYVVDDGMCDEKYLYSEVVLKRVPEPESSLNNSPKASISGEA